MAIENEIEMAWDDLAAAFKISSGERMEELFIFVMGHLAELKAKGIIDGGYYKLGSEGKKIYNKQKAHKFGDSVSEEEMNQTMTLIQMAGEMEDTGA